MSMALVDSSSLASTPSDLQILYHCRLVLVDSTSDSLNANSADRATSDILDSRNRETLLVVVSSGNRTAKSTAFKRGRNDIFALDAENVEAMHHPVSGNIGKNDAEADEWDHVGDTSVSCISDSALDWRENSSTCIVMLGFVNWALR